MVLHIRALAADVEAQAPTTSLLLREGDEGPPPSPGKAPNLLDNSTIEPVLGTLKRSTRPGMRSVAGDLEHLFVVVSWVINGFVLI